MKRRNGETETRRISSKSQIPRTKKQGDKGKRDNRQEGDKLQIPNYKCQMNPAHL